MPPSDVPFRPAAATNRAAAASSLDGERRLAWYAASAAGAAAAVVPHGRLPVPVPDIEHPAPAAFTGAADALAWYETERAGLVAAAGQAEAEGRPDLALALALALGPIHMREFYFEDWSTMSQVAVRAAETTGREDYLALAGRHRGMYLLRSGDYDQARQALSEAVDGFGRVGDRAGAAATRNGLGLVGLRTRDLAGAAGHFTAALAVFTDLGEAYWQAVCRTNLAEARLELGDAPAALAGLDQTAEALAALGETWSQGNALRLLAWGLRLAGDLDGAEAAIGQALAIAKATDSTTAAAYWLLEASRIHLARGEPDPALAAGQRSLGLHHRIGEASRTAMAQLCIGRARARQGRCAEALEWCRLTADQFADLGEAWNEAAARLAAADAAAALADHKAEREQLLLARSLLQSYTDPAASALAQAAATRLNGYAA